MILLGARAPARRRAASLGRAWERPAPKEASHRTAGRAVAEPLRSDEAKGNIRRSARRAPGASKRHHGAGDSREA